MAVELNGDGGGFDAEGGGVLLGDGGGIGGDEGIKECGALGGGGFDGNVAVGLGGAVGIKGGGVD